LTLKSELREAIMDAMTDDSLRQSVTISNPAGLHMRPAQAFVEAASRFQCSVFVARDGGERVNGKSMLNLLSLAAEQGTVVHIEVAGPDCQEALEALVEVLERTYTDE
jgi:phosphotransferase system HPr (HPr) family protein